MPFLHNLKLRVFSKEGEKIIFKGLHLTQTDVTELS